MLFFFVSVRTYVRTYVRPSVTKNCEMSVRPVSVRPVIHTQHTLPNLTQITPTQPKTQVHSTQSKHTHTAKNTPALPHRQNTPANPHSQKHTPTPTQCVSGVRLAHPHSHTVSVQCPSVRCPSVRCPSVRCPSVRCPSSVRLVSVLPVSVFPPSVQPHYCCPSSLQVFILLLVSVLPVSLVSVLHPHGVCPFVTLHHDVVTFNDGVLDQTMVHERTYIMPP